MRGPLAAGIGGLVLVGGLVGGLAWRASRPEPAPPSTPAPLRARQRARAGLEAIARESGERMPDGFASVYLGMSLDALLASRAGVRRGRDSADGRYELWEEETPEGARVVYLVVRGVRALAQVQFMSRLTGVEELAPHFRALRGRYGEPTGFWDCPERPDASPIRRITWRGEAASVMEAILVHPGGVSVTLVVAASGDVALALRRSACLPVTRETLAQWPIATELRGERVDYTRMR